MKLKDLTDSVIHADLPLETLKTFDCNDADLNEFLHKDAVLYLEERFAVTYLFLNEDKVICFFSISNDNLSDKGYSNTFWNRFHRKQDISNAKRNRQYPAVKIGRLGVTLEYQKNGLGSQLLDFIKFMVYDHSKAACRFLLIDAYNKEEVTAFYLKNGFTYLLDTDEGENTRMMFFDLLTLNPDS